MPLAFNPSSPISAGSGVIPWKMQASDYTAQAGERILVDTSAGSWALTLPQAQAGDEIDLFGIAGLESNRLNIILAEAKFENQSLASLKLIKNDYVKLVYAGATIGWMASNKFNLEINLPVIHQELLLDKYPGANLAYANRRISGSYEGFALRVNDGSKNIDIGFTLEDEINTTLSGINVTTWYDQSGKNLDGFGAFAKKPILNKIGGKYVVSFDGGTLKINPFDNSLLASSLANISVFAIFADNTPFGTLFTNDRNNGGLIAAYPSPSVFYFQIENNSSQSVSFNATPFTQKSICAFLRSDSIAIFNRNGEDKSVVPINPTTFTPQIAPLHIGTPTDPNASYYMQGYIAELIIYPKFMANYKEIINELNRYHEVY